MNQDFPWLTTLMLLPMVGGVVVMALPKNGSALPKQVAIGFSGLALALGIAVAAGFSPDGDRYQYTELTDWIPAFGAHYSLGLDGIGLTLVLLTVVLTPIVILASWNDGDDGRYSANAFFAWMLALEGLRHRRLLRDRRAAVLRAVRGDADPGLLPDRRVRWPQPGLRRREVPALQPLRRPA